MKRIFALILGAVITAAALASCGNSGSDTITVVSREDGSGTRSAFVELMGILQDDKDMTYERAEISNSTSVVMCNRCRKRKRYRIYFTRFFERFSKGSKC